MTYLIAMRYLLLLLAVVSAACAPKKVSTANDGGDGGSVATTMPTDPPAEEAPVKLGHEMTDDDGEAVTAVPATHAESAPRAHKKQCLCPCK